MSYVCSADIYFLWALDVQNKKKKEEDGEVWVFLKFQISPLTVSLAYSTSWSAFKSPRKGLDCFIDKSKARKAAFGMCSIRVLKNFRSIPIMKHYCDSWYALRLCSDVNTYQQVLSYGLLNGWAKMFGNMLENGL